jgi:hypothetical protein
MTKSTGPDPNLNEHLTPQEQAILNGAPKKSRRSKRAASNAHMELVDHVAKQEVSDAATGLNAQAAACLEPVKAYIDAVAADRSTTIGIASDQIAELFHPGNFAAEVLELAVQKIQAQQTNDPNEPSDMGKNPLSLHSETAFSSWNLPALQRLQLPGDSSSSAQLPQFSSSRS